MKRHLPAGKGRRFCIIGAGAITTAGGRIKGEWVRDSVKVWASDKAASADTDHHGNFNTELFEQWFEKLCTTLASDYGDCNIMMDGAKYHKRDIDPTPAKQKKKEIQVAWLVAHGVPASMKMKKKELAVLLDNHRTKPIYKAVVIAKKYHHHVLFTPPVLGS
ncbi:hypothetical protein ATCC90586_003581 [Pythium insidiosum]|nr:hypothetical protein ATCC90586_003581 [Pythium insidiosum]